MLVCLFDFGHVVDSCVFPGLSRDLVNEFNSSASEWGLGRQAEQAFGKCRFSTIMTILHDGRNQRI